VRVRVPPPALSLTSVHMVYEATSQSGVKRTDDNFTAGLWLFSEDPDRDTVGRKRQQVFVMNPEDHPYSPVAPTLSISTVRKSSISTAKEPAAWRGDRFVFSVIIVWF